MKQVVEFIKNHELDQSTQSGFIENHELDQSTQSGFRMKNSTSTLLTKFRDDVIKAMNKGEITICQLLRSIR